MLTLGPSKHYSAHFMGNLFLNGLRVKAADLANPSRDPGSTTPADYREHHPA